MSGVEINHFYWFISTPAVSVLILLQHYLFAHLAGKKALPNQRTNALEYNFPGLP